MLHSTLLLLLACVFTCTLAVSCPIDLVVTLDGSTSVMSAQFDQERSFAESMLTAIGVGPSGAGMACVQFASRARVELKLSHDLQAANYTLSGMKQINGGTAIGDALSLSAAQLPPAGKTPRVIVLVTDGDSNQGSNPITVATKLKQDGFTIFAIGVGQGANMKALRAIVTAPADSHSFKLDNFDALEAALDTLATGACVFVDSVSPPEGPLAGGQAVIVSGHGFMTHDGTSVQCRFGSKVVSGVVGNDTAVGCVTPAGVDAGAVPVSVSLDGGKTWSAESDATYTYDKAGCPSPNCGGHGQCLAGKCLCSHPWTGPNCDQQQCSPADCSGHGTCINGKCQCNPGYSGSGCENSACPGSPPCSMQGKCTPNGCQCDAGWEGPDCNTPIVMCCQYCIPDPNWKGHYKPASSMSECWKHFCPGRFPAVLVDSWEVTNADGDMNKCIFSSYNPAHPCIRNYGYCK